MPVIVLILDALLASGMPYIIEYSLEDANQVEFKRCRSHGISVMICSFDASTESIRSVIEQRPDLVNINHLFDFAQIYREIMQD